MIIFSTGGKGGVGKSLVCHLLIAQLGKENCTVIDTDMCNPDVFKCANARVASCFSASLKTPEDWDQLMDCIENTNTKYTVINCQAANQDETISNIEYFSEGLSLLKKKAVMLWVTNEYEDSAQLLNKFLKICPANITVHVVMNNARGLAKKEGFRVWNSDKLRNAVEAQGGKYAYINAIPQHVTDKIYGTERALLADILETGTVSQRLRANKPVAELRDQIGEMLR